MEKRLSELADDYSVVEWSPFFSGFLCSSSAILHYIKIFHFFLPDEKEILILCMFVFFNEILLWNESSCMLSGYTRRGWYRK